MNNLLIKKADSDFSNFNRFKKLPKNPTLGNLRSLIDHLIWLQSFGDMKAYVQGIPVAKIKHFAAEAKSLKAKELRDYTEPKRITLVISLLHHAQMKTRDHITEMFMKRMGNLHNVAKADLKTMKEQHQEKMEHLVMVFKDVLHALDQDDNEEQASQLVISTLKERGSIKQLLEDCEAVSASHGNNYLHFILPHFRSYRATLFRLADLLNFKSTSQDTALIDALTFIQENRHRKSDWLPDSLNLSFLNADWKSLVRVKKRVGGWEISRRHLEACVFSQIATELKSGDICVSGFESFDDFREQLISWEECKPLISDYCKELDLPDKAHDFVTRLKEKLVTYSHQIDKEFPRNDNLSIDKNGKLILKRYKATEASVAAKELERLIKERMPERNVIDILCNVEHWVRWSRHFGPLSGSDPKLHNPRERYILNTFAYGCNLGPAQAARHIRGATTADMLSYVNQRHVTVEKLNQASRDIINHYHKDFDLPKLWGTGKKAAVDGTMYDIYEQNLLAEYHIRYGGYGAIAFHLIADNYIALFSHFIPCGVWEAVYIIEVLLQNKSDVQPDTVHADTQGQSYPVFALAHLLGIKLMPRIRNIKDRSFFRPTTETTYQHIDSLFKGTIDWDLIEAHWADLMQVVLSIKNGKISSAMILRKLGNESRKNKLYQASRELGKAICTLFLLRYVSDIELRQQITSETNKVEAYHGFSGWLCFGGDGIISDNDPEQQEKIIKYNELVSNTVIFQNVVDITSILRGLGREGYIIDSEDVQLDWSYKALWRLCH
ncbi:TnpA family transposase [Baia soyae]|uniref:TnpA family transposase n=1 Tax=Baia soyae TaxID=1544746 RepID=A0A4R2RHP3_9BACL|nr:TnpA family transposase [Baia soyae]